MGVTGERISLHLDDQTNESLEKYIQAKGISKTAFIHDAIIEKLEDVYDTMIAEQAYEEWEAAGKTTLKFEDLQVDDA